MPRVHFTILSRVFFLLRKTTQPIGGVLRQTAQPCQLARLRAPIKTSLREGPLRQRVRPSPFFVSSTSSHSSGLATDASPGFVQFPLDENYAGHVIEISLCQTARCLPPAQPSGEARHHDASHAALRPGFDFLRSWTKRSARFAPSN